MRSYWGYGKEYEKEASKEAFDTLAANGLTLIDTAEVYGFGLSEQFTGEFVRSAPQPSKFQVASKFAPIPWRFTRASVKDACRASLARLEMPRMSLYIQHWPGFGTNGFCNDAFLEGMADCAEAGLCDAVGVSNFNAARVRNAVKALGARGVPLSSNQIQYSLLYREPERNGVLEACREAGVTVVAYSPLAQGLLTGKYTAPGAAKPSGPRAAVFTPARLAGVEALLGVMREIGDGRGGKTPGQIAINWLLCKGTLPIPGVKNARQAQEVAGALGWRLTAEEVRALDIASDKVGTVAFGAPFEKW